MRILGVAVLCIALAGCVTTETVQFLAGNPNQQALMRDGQPALVSKQKTSLVLALQLPFVRLSESMGNHDSNIVDADSVD